MGVPCSAFRRDCGVDCAGALLRIGGDFSFNYRTFNLFGLYMYGHDKNLLVNPDGTGFFSGAPERLQRRLP